MAKRARERKPRKSPASKKAAGRRAAIRPGPDDRVLVSKSTYAKWAGDGGRPRATKVLHDLADRWGFPLRGATIDVAAVIASFHVFLVEQSRRLAGRESVLDPEDDEDMRKWRRERARMAELKRRELERGMLPRDEVHDALMLVAARIRQSLEQLDREYGPEAKALIEDALDDIERDVDEAFSDGDLLDR